jgi:Uma2 family endonuclease
MKPPRVQPAPLPPLKDGDRLSQEEFHRRYEAYPEDIKIELIGGVVHVAAPRVAAPHGLCKSELCGVLGLYHAATPGTEAASRLTLLLSENSEPEPDLLLYLLPKYGGRSRPNAQDYLVGAPEFVAEVSHATRELDLKKKKKDYLDAGVQEYLVVDLEKGRLHWFHFPSRKKLKPDKQGLWKSQVFPGLWLDADALFARDSARLIAAVGHGLASPEHAAFVSLLASRRT